jgi:hypothetical protein
MSKSHVVAQGECMQTIARRHGFSDVKSIWEHPENEELRSRRTSRHVLAPGDVVFIPDPKKKVADCPAERTNRFRVKLPTRDVHVVLIDAAGQPVAGSPYVLHLGGEVRAGKTGGDGAVHEKGFPPDLDRAELELPELGIKRTLSVGHLDPHQSESGWRQRLANLGYASDESGLSHFAQDQGLPEGTSVEALRDELQKHSKS